MLFIRFEKLRSGYAMEASPKVEPSLEVFWIDYISRNIGYSLSSGMMTLLLDSYVFISVCITPDLTHHIRLCQWMNFVFFDGGVYCMSYKFLVAILLTQPHMKWNRNGRKLKFLSGFAELVINVLDWLWTFSLSFKKTKIVSCLKQGRGYQ